MARLYVLVRTDLRRSSAAAQAAHAVAQFLIEHPTSEWRNDALVILEVKDEPTMQKELDRLSYRLGTSLKRSFFREPDLDDELTAVAIELADPDRNALRSLKLLR